jgi:hypothetical protein
MVRHGIYAEFGGEIFKHDHLEDQEGTWRITLRWSSERCFV